MTKALRRAHLYLGVFFTPLLLFFVLTGWYQTVNPDRRKGTADSEDWISRLNRVHVEQYFPTKSAEGYSTKVFTGLVVVMSIALAATVLLGVVLAFQILKNHWVLWMLLVLGILIPALTLWMGQRR